MKTAKVSSVCECQARLGAELDETFQVLRGWTRDRRRRQLTAPCTRAGAEGSHFHLVWLCVLCGRNTLRSFETTALLFEERQPSQQGQSPDEQASREMRA